MVVKEIELVVLKVMIYIVVTELEVVVLKVII
jgi:hypothetical protein